MDPMQIQVGRRCRCACGRALLRNREAESPLGLYSAQRWPKEEQALEQGHANIGAESCEGNEALA